MVSGIKPPEDEPAFSTDYPITAGVRHLKSKGLPIRAFIFPYEERGGTAHSAAMLGEDEHRVIKTIVLQGDDKKLYVVLMHGDREISTKNLARHLGRKSLQAADAKNAEKATGYVFGGTSPFGLRQNLPVYVEASILALPYLWINGGKRGFLLRLSPAELMNAIVAEPVNVAITS